MADNLVTPYWCASTARRHLRRMAPALHRPVRAALSRESWAIATADGDSGKPIVITLPVSWFTWSHDRLSRAIRLLIYRAINSGFTFDLTEGRRYLQSEILQ